MSDLAAKMSAILAGSSVPLYQTHTLGGVELNHGARGVERREFVRLEDICGKRVLDLGCASGAECFWALEQGAEKVLGLDYVPSNIVLMQDLCGLLGSSVIRGRLADLRQGVPADIGSFDTVFAFAVIHHLGYRHLWDEVEGARVVYLEGGGDSPFTAEAMTNANWRATFLGRTPGWSASPLLSRPLLRLERR